MPQDLNLSTLVVKVTNPPLELFVTPEAFQPNPTTVRFARAVQVKPGDTVFDIGTGVGPLAIMAAMMGASRVVGIDPVGLHCRLARMNVEKYGLQNKVEIHQGEFYAPFLANPALSNLKADVIIGDVSGIADKVSVALGWYSPDVPTGGPDGTDVIIRFLKQTPRFMKPTGMVYFPVSTDLSDGQKIIDAAAGLFKKVENSFQKEYFEFPLRPQEVQAILDAYGGHLPPFINIQPGNRPSWRGQIMQATGVR